MGSLLFLLAGTLVVTGGILWFGSSFLIQPQRRPLEARHYELLEGPEEFGLSLESHTVVTSDGTRLDTLLATRSLTPGKATRTRGMTERLRNQGFISHSTPRGTLVLLHGRGGIKENLLYVAQRFVAADFRCIVYDARAHGKSTGAYCTFGKREVQDLEAVLSYYRNRLGERDERIGPVGAFGNSLGAAVVLQSLENFSSDSPRIEAAVAVAPFASLPEIVVNAGQKKIHRHLPPELIHASMHLGGWRAGFRPFSISPLASTARSRTPLFLTHGRLDGVIPIQHSHQIRDASQASPLVWREVPDGYHSNVLATGGDDLYEEMLLFYLENLGAPSGKNRRAETSFHQASLYGVAMR
ncbi:MAG: alpha/beta fold hydrolase [Akkermansiaceae bacterium]